MKLTFKSLKEATEFIERINKDPRYECYFKGTLGKVHVIMEDKFLTIV